MMNQTFQFVVRSFIAIHKPDAVGHETRRRHFSNRGFKEHPRRLEWKMLFVDQPVLNQLPLPFFIEWEEDENTRFEKLRKDGTILPSNDNMEIRECVFRVKDPVKEILKWTNLLSQKKVI